MWTSEHVTTRSQHFVMYTVLLLITLFSASFLEHPSSVPVQCSVSAHSPAWVPHGWHGSLIRWTQAEAPVRRVFEPGTCWPTSTEGAFIELKLPPNTVPVLVSMSAPTSGSTRFAAPRRVVVQTTRHNYSFTYTTVLLHHPPQHFPLYHERTPVKTLRIYALDNWGDPRFTCFFHVRVLAKA